LAYLGQLGGGGNNNFCGRKYVFFVANSSPNEARRLQGGGELASDPPLLVKCSPAALVSAAWDLDDSYHWKQLYKSAQVPPDPEDRIDIRSDGTTLTAGSGVRMVTARHATLSYMDCADQEVRPPIAAIPLTEVRRVHGLCVVTNGQHRTLIKIDGGGGGGRNVDDSFDVHVIIWQHRVDEPIVPVAH
jgi:hypothetical protein